MAECDTCLRWFHPHPCEGVDPTEVQATGKFSCRKCRQVAAASAAAKKMGNGLAIPPPRAVDVQQQQQQVAIEQQGAPPSVAHVKGNGQPPALTAAQLHAWANGSSAVPRT
jgi:hypothetical protein